MTARHKEWVLGYAMLVPAFFFIVGLIAYPAAWAIYLSFTDKVIGQPCWLSSALPSKRSSG
jgi:ABC-type sugar transport system permease subunit